MHRIRIGLLSLILAAISCSAQTNQKYIYGMRANLSLPTVQKNASNFSALPAFGFGISFGFVPDFTILQISNRIEYNRYLYHSPDIYSKISVNSFEYLFGFILDFPKVKGLSLQVHAVPSYSQAFRLYEGITAGTGIKKKSVITGLEHQFDLGAQLGVGINLGNSMNLELSYCYQNSKLAANSDYFDTKPSALKLGLFYSLGNAATTANRKAEVAAQLKKLATDTLYIVNKACSPKMTDSLLALLFKEYYNFSAFRIVSLAEVELLKSPGRALFFALVGEYFGGDNSPESAGIFLLDHNFNLLQYPYPVQTDYPRTTNAECFSSIEESVITIRRFSQRIKNRSGT